MLHTPRLTLRPATTELLAAAIEGSLAHALGAGIPADWPPEYLDDAAFQYTMNRLAERSEESGWWMYFVLRREDGGGTTLIGSGDYKGPPDREGVVEIGYGIVAGERRRGYATEVARALVEHALATPGTRQVIAETLPELVGSIGVLGRCGFRFEGPGSEPGVIRYVLGR